MLKTNGATFKRFYNDDSVWPEDSWHEDEEILVDGDLLADGFSVKDIPNTALVVLSGGVVHGFSDGDGTSLELHFKRWLKRQTTTRIMVECDLSKLDEIKLAIKAAGGKVL